MWIYIGNVRWPVGVLSYWRYCNHNNSMWHCWWNISCGTVWAGDLSIKAMKFKSNIMPIWWVIWMCKVSMSMVILVDYVKGFADDFKVIANIFDWAISNGFIVVVSSHWLLLLGHTKSNKIHSICWWINDLKIRYIKSFPTPEATLLNQPHCEPFAVVYLNTKTFNYT